MPVLADRVQESTTTGGTGTITLAGAVTGYRSFAQAFSIGQETYYTIDNGNGEWEIGVGTVGSGTLSRDSVLESSNANALVNFSAGTKRVFCSAPTKVLIPDQTSNSGKVLTTNGTDPAWTTTLNGMTIGNITPGSGAFTTLSASSTVSGTGFSTYLASPPAIGGTTPAAGSFTTLSSTGNTTLGDASADTLTINGTAVSCPNNLNFDSNTLFIDAASNAVGIGTNTPILGKLNVTTGYAATDTTARPVAFFSSTDSSVPGSSPSGFYIQYTGNATATNRLVELFSTTLGSGSYGAMRLNNSISILSSGNVGIGTSSPGAKLQVSGGRVKIFGDNDPYQLNLFYAPGISGFWLGCPSANALAFYTDAGTERMRIDSSGNLGLGVTPSASYLTLPSAIQMGQISVLSQDINSFYINANASAPAGKYLKTGNYAVSYHLDSSAGSHKWFLAGVGTAGNFIAPTQAMTLGSNGFLLLGKTNSDPTSLGVIAGQLGEFYLTKSTSTNADATYYLYSSGAAAYRFYVGMGGTIYATSTTISAISDQRFKENIKDLDVGLSSILALKPRKFDWKEGKGKDIKGDRGFIAQEFEQVFPDLIDTWKDEPPAGEEPYKAVRADLIPVLVKAIQELHQEVELLKAKVN